MSEGMNNGFAMMEEALALLRRLDKSQESLLRLFQDRPRNSIAEGAVSYGPIAVGTTGPTGAPNPILQANPHRRGGTIVNTGTTTISLGLGSNAPSAGAGVVLAAGASWDFRLGQVVWTGSISAVSSAAGGTLAGVEA